MRHQHCSEYCASIFLAQIDPVATASGSVPAMVDHFGARTFFPGRGRSIPDVTPTGFTPLDNPDIIPRNDQQPAGDQSFFGVQHHLDGGRCLSVLFRR